MKQLLPLIFLFIAWRADAQTKTNTRKLAEQEKLFFKLHSLTVNTCFSSRQLDQAVTKSYEAFKSKTKTTDDEPVFFRATPPLPDSVFKKLTPVEYFIYAHAYPESYMQNCSFSGIESDEQQKIYAHLPVMMEGARPSERQRTSLEQYRDSTLHYLDQCITSDGYICMPYKMTIVKLNACELIPAILATEKKAPAEDTFLYSLLLELMNKNKFATFINSSLYGELYGEGKSYRITIPTSVEKRTAILIMANTFYNNWQKQVAYK